SLAVTLRPGHAKIVGDPAIGVVALFLSHHHDRPALKAAKAANNGRIFRIETVARQRHEVLDQLCDIVLDVRSLGMARHQAFLPRRQLCIDALELPLGLRLKASDLLGDIELFAAREVSQLLDLVLEFSDRLFERSEEHTSELQSRENLVCRLLLEKKKHTPQ